MSANASAVAVFDESQLRAAYGFVPPPLPVSVRLAPLTAELLRVAQPHGLLKELCALIAGYADGCELWFVDRSAGLLRGSFERLTPLRVIELKAAEADNKTRSRPSPPDSEDSDDDVMATSMKPHAAAAADSKSTPAPAAPVVASASEAKAAPAAAAAPLDPHAPSPATKIVIDPFTGAQRVVPVALPRVAPAAGAVWKRGGTRGGGGGGDRGRGRGRGRGGGATGGATDVATPVTLAVVEPKRAPAAAAAAAPPTVNEPPAARGRGRGRGRGERGAARGGRGGGERGGGVGGGSGGGRGGGGGGSEGPSPFRRAGAAPPPGPTIADPLSLSPWALVLSEEKRAPGCPLREKGANKRRLDTMTVVTLNDRLYWMSGRHLFRYSLVEAGGSGWPPATLEPVPVNQRDVEAGFQFVPLNVHRRTATLVCAGAQLMGKTQERVWVYTESTNAWSSELIPPMPKPVMCHSTILTEAGGDDAAADDTLYVLGGRATSVSMPHALSFAYSFASKSWRAIAAMTEPREELAVVALSDGSIVAIGGSSEEIVTGLRTVERYVSADDKWYPLPPMNGCRLEHAAVVCADDSILVCGGFGGCSPEPKHSFEWLSADGVKAKPSADGGSAAHYWLPVPVIVEGEYEPRGVTRAAVTIR